MNELSFAERLDKLKALSCSGLVVKDIKKNPEALSKLQILLVDYVSSFPISTLKKPSKGIIDYTETIINGNRNWVIKETEQDKSNKIAVKRNGG